MLPVPVNAIVEVPAFKVRFAHVPQFQNALLADNVKVPLPIFRVLVAAPVRLMLPEPVAVSELLFVAKSIVPVKAPMVKLATVHRPPPILTVIVPPPELPSKVTLSLVAGTQAHDAPPEVVAHLPLSDVPSTVPVPPIQKQFPPEQAAFAGSDGAQHASARRKRPKSLFIVKPI